MDANGAAVHAWQVTLLKERRCSRADKEICGVRFSIFPGVYQGGRDTELMINSSSILPSETFLEIGCGAGAISIHLARTGASGMGLDINPGAVANSRFNARLLGVHNVSFTLGNVFDGIEDRHNVILFNAPFSSHPAKDHVERMFWDPGDEAKRAFFLGLRSRLLPGGRAYFGWARLGGLDHNLPCSLAEANGLYLARTHTCPSRSGLYEHEVLEFALGEEVNAG